MRRFALKRQFLELLTETRHISLELFKVMIPVLIVVKVLEELGGIKYIGYLLEPLMSLVGLPESMGLVWATTLLTNIYAGMVVFFNLAAEEGLTVAQVTVLSGMLLIAHTLPVEARIAQKAGVRLPATLLMRFFGALLFGFLLHKLYTLGGWLQQPVEMLWVPPTQDASLWGWVVAQLESFVFIVLLIFVLLLVLKILKVLHIERLMIWLLQPVLRLMGIGPEATTITIVGMTLGLAYGGGLLIREAQTGHLSSKDIFSSLAFLAFCHSIIEDTLLVLLLGADLTGVLWLRLLFSLVLLMLITRVVSRLSEPFLERFLVIPHPPK
ncbi:MAG: hypothetical protein MI754_03295 [Chromatiales bacterium]|nr:hypothetical protein [Chromatiales bacterium]